MKYAQLFMVALAAAVLSTSSADAGLLGGRGGCLKRDKGGCCEPASCCEPAPCCDAAPSCCEPAPCCEAAPEPCCEEPAPEPCCDAAPAPCCEPVSCCEPASCCEPEPCCDPCGGKHKKRRFGGCLSKLRRR